MMQKYHKLPIKGMVAVQLTKLSQVIINLHLPASIAGIVQLFKLKTALQGTGQKLIRQEIIIMSDRFRMEKVTGHVLMNKQEVGLRVILLFRNRQEDGIMH